MDQGGWMKYRMLILLTENPTSPNICFIQGQMRIMRPERPFMANSSLLHQKGFTALTALSSVFKEQNPHTELT